MDVFGVVIIVGSLFLFLAAIGGGVRIKEFSIPSMHKGARISLAVVGIVLIALGIALPLGLISSETPSSERVQPSGPGLSALTVVVMYPRGGGPVPGQRINRLALYQDDWSKLFEAVDPPTNVYSWTYLPGGHSYVVEAYVNGMFAGNTPWVALEPGDVKTITIEVFRQGRIKVKVVALDGQTPLEGVWVRILSHDGKEWHNAGTDENGETPWFYVQPTTLKHKGEHYVIKVSAAGDPTRELGSQEVYVEEGQDVVVTIVAKLEP